MPQNIEKFLIEELCYLQESGCKKLISIGTTAKHAAPFLVLPRRETTDNAMSSFMINDEATLMQTLAFFDGIADTILLDVEPKQSIPLFQIAERTIKKSQLLSMKPNDATLESCDLLLRHHFGEDLSSKIFVLLGTGNLSGKLALRLAERQAVVYIKGRNADKEQQLINGLNLMLPAHAEPIAALDELETQTDAVIAFLSGVWEQVDLLRPHIGNETLVIDGGIGNFSPEFLEELLAKDIQLTRLDTRISFPYQLLGFAHYIGNFFDDIYGMELLHGITIAAGGYVGPYGTVIVDRIKNPQQVIGIADGKGGVIRDGAIEEERQRDVDIIKQTIAARH